MKKCVSCTKDLPDAALHCVFCGAKQPPAPAVQQSMAKTAQAAYNPPPYSSSRPAPGPKAPSTRPGPAMAPPPPPPGGFVPASSANAATMFAGNMPPQMSPQGPQPPMQPPPPNYARTNSPAAMLPTLVPAQPQPQPQPPQQPQAPIMRIPAPQPPPYDTSQTASRSIRPVEPWRASLRLMMFLWGLALLAAFATPLRTSPDLLFHWRQILEGEVTARLPPLMLASIGVLSLIVAAIPMQPAARGFIAAILGLAGIAVPIGLVGIPPWQPLSSMIGVLVLVPSLLVRNEYRAAVIPRILVTLGAIGILLPSLLPQGGAIPLVNIFKTLIDVPGSAKIDPALRLGLITVVVMSLLAWLPAPVTGAAKLWAWLLILWALITHVTILVAGGNLGDAVMTAPNLTIVSWIAGGATLGSAYLVLVGYGLASVVGKQLE